MKTKYQITDSTRTNPNVRTRDITVDNSTKEKEAVNLHGRKGRLSGSHLLLKCLNIFVKSVGNRFKPEMILGIIVTTKQ